MFAPIAGTFVFCCENPPLELITLGAFIKICAIQTTCPEFFCTTLTSSNTMCDFGQKSSTASALIGSRLEKTSLEIARAVIF
jgi:hypothetical protein